MSETVRASVTKITRGHSCVLCQQRKVKCDRQKPSCSNCLKARAECVTSTPSLPRRRKRKFTEIDLATSLRKYEHLLRTHGIKFDDEDNSQEPDEALTENKSPDKTNFKLLTLNVPSGRNSKKGALFTDKGNSHYVENPLWEGFNRDDFQYPKDALQAGSSDDDSNDGSIYPCAEKLLVGHALGLKTLTSIHPPPVHVFKLWQTFLVNVNPLVKIFHAPTTQQTILDAIGDLEKVSRPTEALLFNIYFLAVTSLNNASCQSMFGESRQTLLTKYFHGAQQALINSRFLKSLNISTFHAFVLYLLGVRRIYDPHSIWILTGVAVRIAQRLGLHRDGSNHKISPFDAEIRRRTWWQSIFLDGHASKMAGAGFPAWYSKMEFDTKVPLNISDSDLSPAMKETPKEKDGATEMDFCSLRFDVAEAIRNAGSFAKNSEVEWSTPEGRQCLEEKDQAISDLEAQFEQKYGQYCDRSLPLHLLALYVIKSVICTMKIMAHHPRQYPDRGASMPQSEREFLFTQCLTELEIDGLGHTSRIVDGFRWHIQDHFQLDAFIYILSELRHRATGDLVERAWQQVAIAYEYRPEMITDTKNALYFAVGNLTLKAWRKRKESGILSQQEDSNPQYIMMLRSLRNAPEVSRPKPTNRSQQSPESYISSSQTPDFASSQSQTQTQNLRYDKYPTATEQWATGDVPFDMSMPEITPVDWEYWNTLMDGDFPAYAGNAPEIDVNWIP